MFMHIVRSEGLAHLSYMVGDGGEAAVIDPRRDVEVYLDLAEREAVRITQIFETHRNEDYVIGSVELAARTGATIHHGRAAGGSYWHSTGEGDRFAMGSVFLRVLETPGHTDDSISLVLYDTKWSEELAVAVFTGDALFIGDVGRTDFYPDRKEEVAGLLYDSIHRKLLPLGDQVLLYPAHGAGSVCGSGMAKRELSSLGYERRTNELLAKSRDDFVRQKVSEKHPMPRYFQRMERLNQEGATLLGALPRPAALGVGRFEQAMKQGGQVVDVRSTEAYGGASIPGSLSLPLGMLSSFAGYLLAYDRPILLAAEDGDQAMAAVRQLVRMDYVDVAGWLGGGLNGWAKSARPTQRVPLVGVEEVRQRLGREDHVLLDVRSGEEFASGHLPGARHVYVGELAERLDEVPRDRTVTTFCGSGRRAMIAASVLKRAGYERVEDHLGSMSAARSAGLEMEE